MRVAINCRSFLKKNYTGIGRYAFNLVKYLGVVDADTDYQLYIPRRLFDLKRVVPKPPAGNFHLRFDYFQHGPERVLRPCDIYHLPSPEILPALSARIVVTVHDLIHKTYPAGHTSQTIQTTEEQMQSVIREAAQIICCSQSTAKDLVAQYSVPEKRVAMIYQGVDRKAFYPFSAEERNTAGGSLKRQGIPEKFLLFVGTLEPRKNLKGLLAAFAVLKSKKIFDGKLVVVGMKGWMSDDLDQEIVRLGLKEDIILLGYVPDVTLRCLYNLAQVFVFPSFYEGFGFPLLEAMSCGAAIVTSNVSSCPEVVQNAGLAVNPSDPQAIAAAIARILNDPALRESLRTLALRRAENFSFQKTAEETLALYRKVSGEKGSGLK